MLIESPLLIKNPLVSVVVLTFNQQHTISQTIESILAQECDFPYEIIIGEDCGMDNTRDICINYQKNFPEKIKLILHERNKGVVENYIELVKKSSGKYITGCAGDDFWHNENKLIMQVAYMESHPECGILHTDFNRLDSNTGVTVSNYNSRIKYNPMQGYVQKDIFSGKLKICAPTTLFRKVLFDRYIPVDKYLELSFPVEDWPTWLILSAYSEVHYLSDSTVTYRHGHQSLTNPKDYETIEQKYKKEHRMYKFLCEMFPDNLPYDEKEYNIYVKGLLLGLAFRHNDFKSAKKYAAQIKELGDKSMKMKLASNWFTFKLFVFSKKFRRKFFKN